MTKFNVISTLLTALLVLSACGHKQTKFEGAKAFKVSNESNGKGLVAEPTWLKHKKNNIDTQVKITNTYSHAINIKQTGITLTYNGETAIVRQMGRFSSEMGPGMFQMLVLVFDMPGHSPAGGKATVTFNDVYKADGKTKLAPLKIDFTVDPLK